MTGYAPPGNGTGSAAGAPREVASLALVGPAGEGEGETIASRAGEPTRVRVALESHAETHTIFGVRALVTRADDPRAEEAAQAWSVALDPGASWEEPFTFRPDAPGLYLLRVEATLDGEPAARAREIWVRAT